MWNKYLQRIDKILDELVSTSSSRKKIEILQRNYDFYDLQKVLKYAYDKITYTYGVTSESLSA